MPGPTIAIIGGGFSGASVAYHLTSERARILVFEPRASLGQGVAYDTHNAAHRINVPANKMSFVSGNNGHFVDWIERTNALVDDPDATGGSDVYPRREIFGRYVSAQLAPLLSDGRIIHVREAASTITQLAGRWKITTQTGSSYEADIVVLATTHPPPALPSALVHLKNDSRLIADSSRPGALANIAAASNIMIVGTGLTMADVVASLTARGHRGRITAVSRRGLLPRPHTSEQRDPWGEFRNRQYTALGLLRHVRATIKQARLAGIPWQAVIDGVRAQAQTFWSTLGTFEQRRIVKHLRPFWDVHRFRVAPQVGNVLESRRSDGTLHIIKGSLEEVAKEGDRFRVSLRVRGQGPAIVDADFIVVTTGPAHAAAVSAFPHLASLFRAGLIAPDSLGLGIACDRHGRALDMTGKVERGLFIAGPLARGTFGELMGLPQVADYAAFMAAEIKREFFSEKTHAGLQY